MMAELEIREVLDHGFDWRVPIPTRIPIGYVPGMYRGENGENKVTHLYKGTPQEMGSPMCSRGWNDGFGGYSVFRNNISHRGICKICLRRALNDQPPIDK